MDQDAARTHLERFLDSGVAHPTLALLYGRRRIGKSTLLARLTEAHGGFYWEATRGEPAVQLARLGEALGAHIGAGRLAFANWDEAILALLRLARDRGDRASPIVLDEFGYMSEAEPRIDSVVAAALGPARRGGAPGRARLILCGSAISLMKELTAGQAPLRGRAGTEIVMQPFGFRSAIAHLGSKAPFALGLRVYAVIGGVIGYYTDMVDYDVPRTLADFERWIADRVLSPAATLHHEATTLLVEDPTLLAHSATLHHSILGAIANGSVTAGRISSRLGRPVSNLDPALKRLIAAGFVVRHEDPIRSQRPSYALADPLLQFHYAVLEPHGHLIRDRDPKRAWSERLAAIFDSRVRGPVFEEIARTWVRQYAASHTLGGNPGHIGPSLVSWEGTQHELDVVVTAADDHAKAPLDRAVIAVGEAKAGETVGLTRLRVLEAARAALGTRAAGARLLLFAPAFTRELRTYAARHQDVELVDAERLYRGD
jgi:uncharacterized protein